MLLQCTFFHVIAECYRVCSGLSSHNFPRNLFREKRENIVQGIHDPIVLKVHALIKYTYYPLKKGPIRLTVFKQENITDVFQRIDVYDCLHMTAILARVPLVQRTIAGRGVRKGWDKNDFPPRPTHPQFFLAHPMPARSPARACSTDIEAMTNTSQSS